MVCVEARFSNLVFSEGNAISTWQPCFKSTRVLVTCWRQKRIEVQVILMLMGDLLLLVVGESFMRICSTVQHQGHGQSLSSSSIHMPPPLRSIGQPLGLDKVTPVRQPFGSRSSYHLTANHITTTDTLRKHDQPPPRDHQMEWPKAGAHKKRFGHRTGWWLCKRYIQ